MKECRKCGEVKPLGEFDRHAGNKTDGRRGSCKACRLEYDREYNAANRDKRRTYARSYREANRDKFRTYQRKWRERNPDYNPRWRESNRELAVALTLAWASSNPGRVAEASRRRRARVREATIVDFTVEQLEARLSMFAGCWVCGREPEAVDHVKPLAKGGAHALCNLRPICTKCNSSKKAEWPFSANTKQKDR